MKLPPLNITMTGTVLKLATFSALSAVLLLGQPATAAMVKITYTGTINDMYYADCLTWRSSGSCATWSFTDINSTDFIPGSSIAIGDTFAGSFTFESSTVGYVSSDGYQTSYIHATVASALNAPNFKLPMASLSPSPGDVSVVDGRSGYDGLLTQHFYSDEEFFVIARTWNFDMTGNVFDSQALPTNLDGSMFSSNSMGLALLRRSDGDQVQISGQLASFSVSQVPEPTSLALCAVGLAAMGLKNLRRKRPTARFLPMAL